MRAAAAVGENRRPPGEGLGELALLGPAVGDAPDGRLGRLPVQVRLDAGDQADRMETLLRGSGADWVCLRAAQRTLRQK
jgi:hypothetical protein